MFIFPTLNKHVSLDGLFQGKCEITKLSMHVAGLLKVDCERFSHLWDYCLIIEVSNEA